MPAISSAAAIYEGVPVSLQFTNLEPGKHYKMFAYATSEDPSIFMIHTDESESV